jgi:hypothetical protein
VPGLLRDHREDDETKLAIVEQPVAAPAAGTAMAAVMVVGIPALALMRGVGVMAVSAASVSVFHHNDAI